MKILKKVVYFVFMLSLVVCFSPLFMANAEAETVVVDSTGAVTESILTDENQWIVQPVVSGAIGLIGTLLVQALFGGKLNGLATSFNTIVSWFKKKGEDLAQEEVDLKEYKSSLESAVESNKKVQENLESMKNDFDNGLDDITDKYNETQETIKKHMEVVNGNYNTIKVVLMQMAAGNPDLIRNGTADDIIKQLETNASVGEGD